jgi:hypothetical protein
LNVRERIWLNLQQSYRAKAEELQVKVNAKICQDEGETSPHSERLLEHAFNTKPYYYKKDFHSGPQSCKNSLKL